MKLNPLQIAILVLVVLVLLAMAIQKMFAPKAIARPALAAAAPHSQSLGNGDGADGGATEADIERIQSQKMLDTHFIAAQPVVPDDHPLKPIGSCPYSKPLSQDLPMANVPMCMAATAQNMRLGVVSGI